MRHECYFCHTRTIEKLIDKFQPTERIAEDFIFTISKLLTDNRNLPNPFLAAQIHRLAREKFSLIDLYRQEKVQANDLLLKHYDKWKEMVFNHKNPWHMASKLAVAGNIIDYGSHSVEKDINSQINKILVKDFTIDETDMLFQKINESHAILYLGDNAGEIVFDKLFIEIMNHREVTYVVRGTPVINDVTLDDALQTGIGEVCKVITNGYDAPSTIVEHGSDEFKDAFEKSDLIISKGQGNYEGLMNAEKDNIFFMLMAKCSPIANLLHVNKGDLIVTSGK